MTLTFWRRWQVETFALDGGSTTSEQHFTLREAERVAAFADFLSCGRYRSRPVRAKRRHVVHMPDFNFDVGFKPRCSCGWVGTGWSIRRQAEDEAAAHAKLDAPQ